MSISSTQRRIARLATLTAVHRAFHWLHLHQPQLRQWQLDIVRIPAPTFAESARAAWFLDRFLQLGLTNIHIDDAGNVLGELAPEPLSNSKEAVIPIEAPDDPIVHRAAERTGRLPHLADTSNPASAEINNTPVLLLSAHLDTVFPATTLIEPVEEKDTRRIYAPGICDNAAGLTAMLAIIAALKYANITPPIPILFAANVGEEGEGDLRGMRHLFERGPYRHRIAASIALEGGGSSAVVTRALGSLRFRATISGPGGHSWADAGTHNPIVLLSQAIARIAAIELPADPPTTINVGHISGGTSVNSIPESATALLDIRSTDANQLTATAATIHRIFEEIVTPHPAKRTTTPPPKLHIEPIGNRPAAALPDDSPLLQTLRAVDRHLTLRTEPRLGSTDANIPLSRGVPAIAIGGGGQCGGIHTLQEWYDPTGRETALRRILLTLLDTLDAIATLHPT